MPPCPLTLCFFSLFSLRWGQRLRSRGAACGRYSRGGAGANTATASCGRNRELCLAQCSNFYKGIHARRKNWLSTRGQPSKFSSGPRPAQKIWATATRRREGWFSCALPLLPFNTLFLFPFFRSAGARGPGRGFRLPLPRSGLRCPVFASGVVAPSQKADRCPCSASAVSAAGSASASQPLDSLPSLTTRV